MYSLLLLAWVLAILMIVLVFKYSYHHYQLYQLVKRIPGPEYRFPLWGNLSFFLNVIHPQKTNSALAKEFLSNLMEICDTYSNDKHGLVKLWLGPFIPYIIVTKPETALTVLKNSNYLDKATFYRLFKYAIYDGIFSCDGDKWRNDKRELQVHFKIKALETYIPKTQRHLVVLDKRIEKILDENDGIVEDIKPVISTYVLDVLGENIFSTEFNSQATGEPKFILVIHKMLDASYKSFLQPWTYSIDNFFLQFFINFKVIRESFTYIMTLMTASRKIIINRFKHLLENRKTTEERSSLLDSLIEPRVVDSKITDIININAQLNTLIVAGHDTTTTTILWILYLLGHHLEIQNKLIEEVDWYLEELKSNDERITTANLKNLKFLNCCIKEALRLYSPGPFIGRQGRTPIQLDDEIIIPPHISVLIFIRHIHLNKKYFKEPTRFFPERWNKEETTEDTWVTKLAFMPFSNGLRMCVGKDYGLLQQKLFFVNFLSKYRVNSLDKYGSNQPNFNFLLCPPHFSVRIERRNPIVNDM